MRLLFCLLISFFSCIISRGQVDLNKGLVAYYPFNGNANDASGNNHHGTLVNGVALTNDRFGNANTAFRFDGIDDYIRIVDDGAFSTPHFSLVVWFQSESNTLQNLIAKRDYATTAGTGGAQYQMFINYPPYPGIGSNIVGNNSNCSSIASSSYLNTGNNVCSNKWICGVITFDGSRHKMYINGELKRNELAGFTGLLSCKSELRFGNWFKSELISFKGFMDDIRWYNRALNETEVEALFDGFPSTTPLLKVADLVLPCVGGAVDLTASSVTAGSDAGLTYTYWKDAAATISLSNPNAVTLADTYYIKASLGNNCSVIKPIVVSRLICQPVSASFTAPDTVCVNTPVTIANTSIGASTYFWNFCVANTNTTPVGNNLGNIGGAFKLPVYIDYVYEAGNYYGFLTNNYPGKLLRLNFGNSLLNTPTVTDLGRVGGAVPDFTEGLQVVKNEGKWYVIIVGGNVVGAPPAIGKVELGTSITNNSPSGTYWGNLGNMNYPHDLYMFNDNGRWYGFTVNTNNNTITKFDFTTSFSNTPTATNLGNIGSLDGPTGVYAIKDNDNWHVFVTNAYSSTLTRLDFGNSLLNVPTGTNLGNISGKFNRVWDIQIMKFCGEMIGFVINAGSSELLKLDFKSSITNVPTITNYGNIGSLNFPHCLSKIFRVGSDLYSFIPNVDNNSLSRIRFTGCSNSNIANSNLNNPPSITYNTPGTYSINLTIDDGLPTQSAICKQVVVLPVPAHAPLKALSICDGDSIKVGTSNKYSTYTWNNGAAKDSIYINSAGTYWVEVNQKGCINRDSFSLIINEKPDIKLRSDTMLCKGTSIQLYTNPKGTYTYSWAPATGLSGATSEKPLATPLSSTRYIVTASSSSNCIRKDTIMIAVNAIPNVVLGKDTAICFGDSLLLDAKNSGASYQWQNGSSSQTFNAKLGGRYYVEVTKDGCAASDTVQLAVNALPNISALKDTAICEGGSAKLTTQASGVYSYSWFPTTGLSDHATLSPVATPVVSIRYILTATSNEGCIAKDTTHVSVNSKPTISLTKDTSICSNTLLLLNASGGMSYQWYPLLGLSSSSVPNPIASPSATTKYFVTVTNDKACTNIDSVTITVKHLAVFTKPENKLVCEGETVQLLSDANYKHQWHPTTFLSNATISNPLVTPTATITYAVTITDPVCKNDSSFMVEVKVNPRPKLKVEKSNDIDCTKSNAQLTVSGADEYIWQPAEWLSNPSIANPIATALSTTKYKVTGTSINGCSNTDSITVKVEYAGELGLLIPSAFTPNADGKNDCFGIKRWQSEGNIELSIYNRWGELLFNTKNPIECWNGTFKGNQQPSGVYVYLVKGNSNCGEIFKKGTFTLIR